MPGLQIHQAAVKYGRLNFKLDLGIYGLQLVKPGKKPVKPSVLPRDVLPKKSTPWSLRMRNPAFWSNSSRIRSSL